MCERKPYRDQGTVLTAQPGCCTGRRSFGTDRLVQRVTTSHHEGQTDLCRLGDVATLITSASRAVNQASIRSDQVA